MRMHAAGDAVGSLLAWPWATHHRKEGVADQMRRRRIISENARAPWAAYVLHKPPMSSCVCAGDYCMAGSDGGGGLGGTNTQQGGKPHNPTPSLCG